MNHEKIVPDTSVIIEGLVTAKIESGELKPKEILIHEAVLAELEHQANEDKAIGFIGLEELKKLRKLCDARDITMRFSGKRPSAQEIRHANLGEIDSMIHILAYDEDATLVTADKIQARVAETKGIPLLFYKIAQQRRTLKLESYFDDTTMSAHLREKNWAFAKKGRPGAWTFDKVSKELLSRDDIQEISTEIIEEASTRDDGFIEIERPGSTIVQLGKFRIVITKPPFSDGWEITAVRPVKRLSMADYKLSEKLMQRVGKQAEGILIAGAPGMGKSTFAQALAEFYADQNKIVKTIEAPRDLILKDNITQYAISHGDAQEIHDILLLSRPDNTIFDEMRNTSDFALFADLRLSGIGLAGVVHATNAIDAVQRFVGRIELGVIPQVIDTVIFIKNGAIDKVLALEMVVKVPAGMTEADLARPVVVVSDFESGKAEFELYTYGEETVVIRIKESARGSPAHELAAKAVRNEMLNYTHHAEVEMVGDHKCIVSVPEEDIARIIGKQGKTVEQIERKLGVKIDVRELQRATNENKQSIPFDLQMNKGNIKFYLGAKNASRDVDILVGGDYLFTVKVGSSGVIKLNKKNKVLRLIQNAYNEGKKIELLG